MARPSDDASGEINDQEEEGDAHAPVRRPARDARRQSSSVPDEGMQADLLPILSTQAAPPASLRDRILAAARPQPFAFVTQHEGPWLPSADAEVAVKALLADSRDRLSTRLVRFRAASALPDPELPGRRAFYVIRGQVARGDGSATLGAGAFRDEYPPQKWRADGGTLVIEYADHASAGSVGQTLESENATWIDALPGGRVRPLEGGDDGPRSFLVLSMSPGSTLPSHPHHGIEELYVLSGSCTIDGRPLSAGDYHRAASHSTHPDTHTLDEGCDVLVALRDPDRVAGEASGAADRESV